MVISDLWLLLLPVAAASGWFVAKRKDADGSSSNKQKRKKDVILSRDYLLGLNFLLNEEHDKALSVFIKMLEVDSDTIETHLTLGNLFRRRGEVERAIRIHQNLIARPNLERTYRTQALMALARDYLSAGVLDRAERLFLELIDLGESVEKSSNYLLDIYQQEKEWQKAINVAQKLGSNMNVVIAHYYCELAELDVKGGHIDQASRFLKRALAVDKHCVRASLLFAKLDLDRSRYKQAIRHLKRVKEQNSDFFSEAILPLGEAYKALSKEKDLVFYFKDVLKEFPRIPIAIMLSEEIRQWRGDKVAVNFVADYVRKHPSVAGLHRLVELHLLLVEGKARDDLLVLRGLTEKLLAEHATYQCANCGFAGNKIHWQCPSCKQWSTVKPTYALEG
jgi:lipopolysaccharide assembly protein B